MEIKSVSRVELGIIKKFSKFIIKFDNTLEFIEYIKKNEFKVDGFGMNYWIPKKYHELIEKYLFYSIKHDYRKISKDEFKALWTFEHLAILLRKRGKKIWLIPLDLFIKQIDNWREDIQKLYDDMDNFNKVRKSKKVLLYVNKEYMHYDEKTSYIKTTTIYREYIGSKESKKSVMEETKILVKGEDDKVRDINQEAIFYFKQKGFKAVLTKWWKGNYLYNFLEKEEIIKIFKKEDLKKIQLKEKIERPYQFSLTGFPDLFVWNEKGNYFFVEVKSEKDKLHRSQYEWIRWNERIGKFNFKILNIFDKK